MIHADSENSLSDWANAQADLSRCWVSDGGTHLKANKTRWRVGPA